MKHFIFASLFLLSTPALAAPFTYAPESCEFQITFPEKPFIEKKCGSNVKDCAEIVSYTKTMGGNSSTNFRVTCTSLSLSDAKKYTPEIIEETLKQLAKSNNLIPYDAQSFEKDGYRNSSTISLSERDGKPLIYNGQIWVGKTSMLTIEAELLGEQNNVTEKTFADILRGAHPKDVKQRVASTPKAIPKATKP